MAAKNSREHSQVHNDDDDSDDDDDDDDDDDVEIVLFLSINRLMSMMTTVPIFELKPRS